MYICIYIIYFQIVKVQLEDPQLEPRRKLIDGSEGEKELLRTAQGKVRVRILKKNICNNIALIKIKMIVSDTSAYLSMKFINTNQMVLNL